MALKETTFSVTASGASAGVRVQALGELMVGVSGTFVATYDLEVSFDGTIWHTALAFDNAATTGRTTTGLFRIIKPFAEIRINVTAFTSGTIVVSVMGVSRD